VLVFCANVLAIRYRIDSQELQGWLNGRYVRCKWVTPQRHFPRNRLVGVTQAQPTSSFQSTAATFRPPALCRTTVSDFSSAIHTQPSLKPAIRGSGSVTARAGCPQPRYTGTASLYAHMDIRKWLDETVQPKALGEPVEPREQAEPPKRRRQRKRSKSDSSFLAPAPIPPPSFLRRRKSLPEIAQKPAIGRRTADDSASEAPQEATVSDSSTSSRYARKPRRKTRPEHYEPGSHADRGRKGESKKTRRKSKRKKREQPGIGGIVQNFQAKNVSGDRLTVKCPCSSLGVCAVLY
jgi:hypothetical protein